MTNTTNEVGHVGLNYWLLLGWYDPSELPSQQEPLLTCLGARRASKTASEKDEK